MTLQTFTLDPAATALEDAPKTIRNETGGTLAAGDLVYITSWSEVNSAFLVAKADADVPGAAARLILRASLATATNGNAFRTYRLTALDTSAGAIGDPVYLSAATPGSWTLTAPIAASSFQQIVGRVAVVNALAGVVEFDLIEAAAVKAFGSNELQAAAVTAAKLASTASRDNLDALPHIDRKYVRTNPVTGQYKIIHFQRNAVGLLEIEYDDVAVP